MRELANERADGAGDAAPVPRLTRDNLLEVAAALAARFAPRGAEHDRAGTLPVENLAELRAAGWHAMSVPARLGGLGYGLADAVRAHEILATGDASTALGAAMHVKTIGAAADGGRAWPAAAFEAVCRATMADGAWINSCASEPELGSPSRGGLPRTVARRVADGWRVDGRKNFATMAEALDWLIIPAAIEGEEGVIGRFLVPRGAGVRVVETWDPMGMRATGSHDLVLEAVDVPDDALLFRQSASAPGAHEVKVDAWFTLLVTAVYLGVAAGAHRAALDFANARVPTALGRPIATLEGIQRRLGVAEVSLRAARALVGGAAEAWEIRPAERAVLAEEVVAAKLFATNAALAVVDEAMRVAGGSAMRRDLPLERAYRDVRGGLYHPPSDDQGHALLGRLALRRREGRTA